MHNNNDIIINIDVSYCYYFSSKYLANSLCLKMILIDINCIFKFSMQFNQ